MNTTRSLLLVAGLGLASCAGSPVRTSTADAAAVSPTLTVHVVEASGGA